MADACAERFGGGLFRGEAGGEVSGWACLGLGVSNFAGMKNTFEKAIAETVEGVFDAIDFD